MAQNYFEVRISNIPREQEDTLSGFLFSLGASGVSEDLAFEQKDVRFHPTLKHTDILQLVAYFESLNGHSLSEQVQAQFPAVKVEISKQENKDWLEEWKKGFEPFSLCEDIWIVPSWHKKPEAAKLPIYIDPGMAFGTGTHETTQICSRLIYDFLQENPVENSFDIGTGTGVLAILMEKLGIKDIGCCDIDPECRRVSSENFEKNDISHCHWNKDISSYNKPLDLIVANIIDGVLLDLKEEIISAANVNTSLILSGILAEREEPFLKEFLAQSPYQVIQRKSRGEWLGFLLQRK